VRTAAPPGFHCLEQGAGLVLLGFLTATYRHEGRRPWCLRTVIVAGQPMVIWVCAALVTTTGRAATGTDGHGTMMTAPSNGDGARRAGTWDGSAVRMLRHPSHHFTARKQRGQLHPSGSSTTCLRDAKRRTRVAWGSAGQGTVRLQNAIIRRRRWPERRRPRGRSARDGEDYTSRGSRGCSPICVPTSGSRTYRTTVGAS